MADELQLRAAGRFRWEKELLRTKTSTPTVKLIGLVLAAHSDAKSGGRIWPGSKLLAEECAVSLSTVQRGLTELERLGLVVQVSKGRSYGRGYTKGLASEWQLTLPVTVEVGQNHSAPVTDGYGKDQAPATDGSGNHRSNLQNHQSPGDKPPVKYKEVPVTPDTPSRHLTSNQEPPDPFHLRSRTREPRDPLVDAEAYHQAHSLLRSLPLEEAAAWLREAMDALGADAGKAELCVYAVKARGESLQWRNQKMDPKEEVTTS